HTRSKRDWSSDVCSSDLSPESIAEFAVYAAMRLIRNSDEIDQRVASQNFTWEPSIRSHSIQSLKVAVIGVGRIGSRVAKIYKHRSEERRVGKERRTDRTG